jgi:hypothetical protein
LKTPESEEVCSEENRLHHLSSVRYSNYTLLFVVEESDRPAGIKDDEIQTEITGNPSQRI